MAFRGVINKHQLSGKREELKAIAESYFETSKINSFTEKDMHLHLFMVLAKFRISFLQRQSCELYLLTSNFLKWVYV